MRVRLAAICGSDLHVYHGRETGLDPGTIMGHEMVGEIVEVGAEAAGLAPGDLVASPFSTSCGRCFSCGSGLTSRCPAGQLFGWVEQGSGLEGTQAELVRVPLAQTTLVRLPRTAPLEPALLLADVLPTGFFAAELGGVGPGTSVAVLGCGPVGLMSVVAARELGAERICAADTLPERLALAEHFGARAIRLGEGDPVAALRRATGGRGPDAVLEAVGSPEAGRLAFELVRPGGTIAAVGVHTETHLPFSPAEAYDKNLGYRTGRCPARSYIDRLLPLALSEAYELTAVFSHRLPLADGPRAYDLFARRLDGCTKVALEP